MKKFVCKMKPEEVTKLLQEGKVIKDVTSDAKYKLLNGLLYNSKYRSISNALFLDDDDLYFEIDEPFQITEPGFYKTRDGRKAFVCMIVDKIDTEYSIRNEYIIRYVIEGSQNVLSATKNGRYFESQNCKDDIVSKWED